MLWRIHPLQRLSHTSCWFERWQLGTRIFGIVRFVNLWLRIRSTPVIGVQLILYRQRPVVNHTLGNGEMGRICLSMIDFWTIAFGGNLQMWMLFSEPSVVAINKESVPNAHTTHWMFNTACVGQCISLVTTCEVLATCNLGGYGQAFQYCLAPSQSVLKHF